jgi:hypothetical protein
METTSIVSPRPETEFVTLPELAAISEAEGWGISYRNFRAYYLTGRLPAITSGNRPKVKLTVVRAMLADTNSALYRK